MRRSGLCAEAGGEEQHLSTGCLLLSDMGDLESLLLGLSALPLLSLLGSLLLLLLLSLLLPLRLLLPAKPALLLLLLEGEPRSDMMS